MRACKDCGTIENNLQRDLDQDCRCGGAFAETETLETPALPPPPSLSEGALELLRQLDAQRADPDCEVPVIFLTGSAGTGKTYTIKLLLQHYPRFALIAATTGIAAVNLGTTTIHSALRYFNTESLEDAFVRGRLQTLLHAIGHQYDNICVDEVSMADGRQANLWYKAAAEVNQYESMTRKHRKLGIILTGDFCQLPPVNKDGKTLWAHEAEVWEHFAKHVVRLSKVWRQGGGEFLEALNLLRAGDGLGATKILKRIVTWVPAINREFDGTTIMATNKEVNRHNELCLSKIPGPVTLIPATRKGKMLGEWKLDRDGVKEPNIPEAVRIKEGAYVMLLANAANDSSEGFFDFNQVLEYANGDCGHVTRIDNALKCVFVKLKRNGEEVGIGRITRYNLVDEEPSEPVDGYKPVWMSDYKKYAIGEITFLPLRLAYAATVHKTQGLTLDRIQIDSRAHFFGSPGMAYVALSRARTAEGVYIVGSPTLFATKVKTDEKVKGWL